MLTPLPSLIPPFRQRGAGGDADDVLGGEERAPLGQQRACVVAERPLRHRHLRHGLHPV